MNLLCFFNFHKEPKTKVKGLDKLGYTLTEYKCKRCNKLVRKWTI